jgi:hypothetical protein
LPLGVSGTSDLDSVTSPSPGDAFSLVATHYSGDVLSLASRRRVYVAHARARYVTATGLTEDRKMGWIFGIVYFVLMVTLGVLSLRKGHWVMFIIGLFIPIFWFIGALMPRRVARP